MKAVLMCQEKGTPKKFFIFQERNIHNPRLVFSRFVDISRNLGVEKLVSPVKKAPGSTHLLGKILPGRIFLMSTEFLILISSERDVEKGKNM